MHSNHIINRSELRGYLVSTLNFFFTSLMEYFPKSFGCFFCIHLLRKQPLSHLLPLYRRQSISEPSGILSETDWKRRQRAESACFRRRRQSRAWDLWQSLLMTPPPVATHHYYFHKYLQHFDTVLEGFKPCVSRTGQLCWCATVQHTMCKLWCHDLLVQASGFNFIHFWVFPSLCFIVLSWFSSCLKCPSGCYFHLHLSVSRVPLPSCM